MMINIKVVYLLYGLNIFDETNRKLHIVCTSSIVTHIESTGQLCELFVTVSNISLVSSITHVAIASWEYE
jgi:hypothetical protein